MIPSYVVDIAKWNKEHFKNIATEKKSFFILLCNEIKKSNPEKYISNNLFFNEDFKIFIIDMIVNNSQERDVILGFFDITIDKLLSLKNSKIKNLIEEKLELSSEDCCKFFQSLNIQEQPIMIEIFNEFKSYKHLEKNLNTLIKEYLDKISLEEVARNDTLKKIYFYIHILEELKKKIKNLNDLDYFLKRQIGNNSSEWDINKIDLYVGKLFTHYYFSYSQKIQTKYEEEIIAHIINNPNDRFNSHNSILFGEAAKAFFYEFVLKNYEYREKIETYFNFSLEEKQYDIPFDLLTRQLLIAKEKEKFNKGEGRLSIFYKKFIENKELEVRKKLEKELEIEEELKKNNLNLVFERIDEMIKKNKKESFGLIKKESGNILKTEIEELSSQIKVEVSQFKKNSWLGMLSLGGGIVIQNYSGKFLENIPHLNIFYSLVRISKEYKLPQVLLGITSVFCLSRAIKHNFNFKKLVLAKESKEKKIEDLD